MSKRTDLIRARERLLLTRPQLAKRLGIGRVAVYRVEEGMRDPSAALMRRWVKKLGPGASMDLFRKPPQAADAAE
jgi:transcriptional regulator with XRE-family HTH domain